jgi:very-short-patch-repair endonuclease
MTAYHHYNKHLKGYAREHRNDSTQAEIRMWTELLRNKQMLGYSFLRQRPIDSYIADFFCKQLKLVIDVTVTHIIQKRRNKKMHFAPKG